MRKYLRTVLIIFSLLTTSLILTKHTQVSQWEEARKSLKQNETKIDYNQNTDQDRKDDEDYQKTLAEIVTENGFLFEEHWVTTSDGYILSLLRIPGQKNETNM